MKLRISNRFLKKAANLVRKNPLLKNKIDETIVLLEQDIFNPSLNTHKLKGKLNGYWSSSAGYDLRIIFEITDEANEKVILLHSAGTHDEVY